MSEHQLKQVTMLTGRRQLAAWLRESTKICLKVTQQAAGEKESNPCVSPRPHELKSCPSSSPTHPGTLFPDRPPLAAWLRASTKICLKVTQQAAGEEESNPCVSPRPMS